MNIKNIVKSVPVLVGLLFLPQVSAIEDNWTPLNPSTYQSAKYCHSESTVGMYHHHAGILKEDEHEPRRFEGHERSKRHFKNRLFQENGRGNRSTNKRITNQKLETFLISKK